MLLDNGLSGNQVSARHPTKYLFYEDQQRNVICKGSIYIYPLSGSPTSHCRPPPSHFRSRESHVTREPRFSGRSLVLTDPFCSGRPFPLRGGPVP